jgi:hypothetical protein
MDTIKTIELVFAAPVPVAKEQLAGLYQLVSTMTTTVVALETEGPELNSLTAIIFRTSGVFALGDDGIRLLDAVCGVLCGGYNKLNPTMLMWPSGAGYRPQWSMVDSLFLGRAPDANAPPSGEPTFDETVYQIDCTCREDYYGRNPYNPDGERLRESYKEQRLKEKADLPRMLGCSRMADNDKAVLVSFDKPLTDDQMRDMIVRFL